MFKLGIFDTIEYAVVLTLIQGLKTMRIVSLLENYF